MELNQSTLKSALEEAADYHHEYEANVLGGTYDEAWADWYGAFLIGKIPELEHPSKVVEALQMAAEMHERDVNKSTPWADFYAHYVVQYLQGD